MTSERLDHCVDPTGRFGPSLCLGDVEDGRIGSCSVLSTWEDPRHFDFEACGCEELQADPVANLWDERTIQFVNPPYWEPPSQEAE